MYTPQLCVIFSLQNCSYKTEKLGKLFGARNMILLFYPPQYSLNWISVPSPPAPSLIIDSFINL